MIAISSLSKGRAREHMCFMLAIPDLGQPERT